LHKAFGQAGVVLDGQSAYLGKWDTPESHRAYERAISEWPADQVQQVLGVALVQDDEVRVEAQPAAVLA
jgi:hypothetical protein